LGGETASENKIELKLLPLHEIISLHLSCGINTKRVWEVYNNLIKEFGNEFNILLDVSRENLSRVIENEKLVELILKNREGKINVKPGYDGVYGVAQVGAGEKQERLF
jgi:PHP family Zn ribbon phosphoesterase